MAGGGFYSMHNNRAGPTNTAGARRIHGCRTYQPRHVGSRILRAAEESRSVVVDIEHPITRVIRDFMDEQHFVNYGKVVEKVRPS